MTTLKQFSHEMWLQNCDERAAWSLPVLTEEEYTEHNADFLQNEYFTLVLERFIEGEETQHLYSSEK